MADQQPIIEAAGSLSNIPIIQNFEAPVVWILCFAVVIQVDDDTKYLVWSEYAAYLCIQKPEPD